MVEKFDCMIEGTNLMSLDIDSAESWTDAYSSARP